MGLDAAGLPLAPPAGAPIEEKVHYLEKAVAKYLGETRSKIASAAGSQSEFVPKSAAVAQQCPFAGGCGLDSSKCKEAQSDPKVADILKRVERMRKVAIWMKWDGARKALDSYLGGSGKFQEIPQEHMNFVKKQVSKDHHGRMIKKHFEEGGLKRNLAAQLSPYSDGPVIKYSVVEFDTEYTGGEGEKNYSDINNFLQYNSTTIKSRISWKCERASDNSYICNATKVKSWTVDNYDWEGNKSIAGNLPLGSKLKDFYSANLIPSQGEMDYLRKVGCASPFQRASQSWTEDTSGMQQAVKFNDIEDISKSARQHEARQEDPKKVFEETGRLPQPSPADEQNLPQPPSKPKAAPIIILPPEIPSYGIGDSIA